MSLPSFQLRALWISIISDLKVWGIQSVFQRFLHCILRAPNPLHFQTWQISWEGNSHAFQPGHTPQEEPCLLSYCKTTGDFSILDWGSLTSHSAPKFSIGAAGKNNCAFRAPKFPNCCQPLETSKYLLVPLSVSSFTWAKINPWLIPKIGKIIPGKKTLIIVCSPQKNFTLSRFLVYLNCFAYIAFLCLLKYFPQLICLLFCYCSRNGILPWSTTS